MRVVAILALAGVLAGCANPQAKNNFSKEMSSGDMPAATQQAMASANIKDGQPTDLLWALEAGTLLKDSGLQQRSTKIFDGAENLMKNDDTRAMSSTAGNQALSMVANDNVMPYSPAIYDTVMINTYKALNFWQQGDFDGARVEWNRSDDRQRRAAEHFAKEITAQREAIAANGNPDLISRSLSDSEGALKTAGVDTGKWEPYTGYVNPAALYLHGLYFLLNGQNSGDYAKARQSLQRAYELTRNTQVKMDLDAVSAKRFQKVKSAVWVVFENGLAAHKVERRIDLPLFLVSGGVKYTGIALPIMEDGTPAYPYVSVGNQQSQNLADMSTIIEGEYKTHFNAILIKEIIRATAKTILQKQINDSNPLLGSFAAAAQALSTQADLRGWSTLPENFQLLSVPYPLSNKLTLSFPGRDDVVVDLPADKQPVVVYVRAFNSVTAPHIDVLASKGTV
jgi:hypothetical protein